MAEAAAPRLPSQDLIDRLRPLDNPAPQSYASRMRLGRGVCFLGVLAAALVGSHARGDDQDSISSRGDALARATSAQALVRPAPAYPPGMPAVPKTRALTETDSQGSRGASPTDSAQPPAAADAARPPSRTLLVVLGALAAVGLFLWERRKPGAP